MTIKELYTVVYPIRDKDLMNELIKCTKIRKYKKEELVFEQDTSDTNICFLKTGIAVVYEIYPNGKTICSRICDKPGEVIAGGVGPNDPYSPVNIRMLTSGEMFVIPLQEILRMQKEYPEITILYNRILMYEYEKLWQINNMLYMESAEDRYKWFLCHYPGTIDKVRHNVIASFLRMSQVTISRVRKRTERKS